MVAQVRAFAAMCLALVVASGCGGEDSGPVEIAGSSTEATGAQLPGWVDAELGSHFVALTMGTSDYAPGNVRVSFLVVRNNGSLVQSPRAEILIGPDGGTAPTGKAEAVLEPIGAHSHPGGSEPHDHEDITDLYVAHVSVPKPGRYWLVVSPAGADVRERTASVPVGARAPVSENPTVADRPATQITTARPPDTDLLRFSVADSLAEHVPFVVVFATPAYCMSRTCGPTVETVQEVAQQNAGSGIRFIHIEIYQDNDPKKGFNEWVREWRLPTEPWIFLVDGSGRVRAKLEGAVSVDELAQAVRDHLRSGP
jgi:hypothetical protein